MTTQKKSKSEEKIIEKLASNPYDRIPDTRKLQQLRIDSIGQENGYEEHIRKRMNDKMRKFPRIILLSEKEQQTIYSLAIPLAFPPHDLASQKDIKSKYYRFQGDSIAMGAMHVTTERNLEQLMKLFFTHNISMRLEEAYGEIFNGDRVNRPAITVPHSWYIDTYDPDERPLQHQFVTCEQDIIAIPYVFLEELSFSNSTEKTEDNSKGNYLHETLQFASTGNATIRRFESEAVFSSTPHKMNVEEYLSKSLGEKAKQKIGKSENHNRLDWIIKSATAKPVFIGNPIQVYDPNWIEKDHKPTYARRPPWAN